MPGESAEGSPTQTQGEPRQVCSLHHRHICALLSLT